MNTSSSFNSFLNCGSVTAWTAEALAEPWDIPDYEAGHEAVETYRVPA